MSKDIEFRSSPSPVAKLMGLDVMPVPPQQSTCKQQKKPPVNYLQRTMSFGKSHRCGPSDDDQLLARSLKDQGRFTDVYEDMEASVKESSGFSAPKATNLKLARAEMEFIQKKFMDAKRLATDEKLRNSKEFHDALEVLDSNKNILLKYLQQPDSLFTKHLHDIKDVLSHSNCSHMAAMKSSDDKNHKCCDSGRKSARRYPRKKHTKSRKHCNCHFNPSDCNNVGPSSLNASRVKVEEDEGLTIFPKRIVVLKPNLGKVHNASGIFPSSSRALQTDCRKQSEFERTKIREIETLRKKNYHDQVGFSRHKARDPKEIYKITRRMRENFDTGPKSSLGIIGHNRSKSFSIGNDLDDVGYNSSDMFGLNGQWRSSSFQHKTSSLSREAKKRLWERWRMTSDCHGVGIVNRICTLAEMLAMPEKEIVPAHLEPRFGEGSGFKRDDGPTECMESFGISSRDGWKDICLEKLSRSKSLPASSTSFESLKTRPQSLRMDRFVMPKEPYKWEKKETISESLCKRECKVRRNSRSTRRKSRNSSCTLPEYYDPVLEIHSSQNQDSDRKDEDLAEKNLLVIEESTFFHVKDQTQVVENENRTDMRVRPDNAIVSSHEELPPESLIHSMVEDDSYSGDHDCLMPTEPLPEAFDNAPFHLKSVPRIESPLSSKEADHPSPVSVLEPPFTDDPPLASDCFQSLSADLHGLRMQLKLLKLETKAFEAEGPQHISSDDDDTGEGSIPEKKEALCEAEGNWEFSYLTDVLHNSALNDTEPDMFVAMWHSLECPVDPSIFEELEKKYADWPSQLRSERRLLFDRINLGILDIYQQFTDPHPWVRPQRIQVGDKEGLCYNLIKLVAKQVKKVDEDIVEKVLGRRSEWLVLGYDIDVIGKEIEKHLIDDLVAEVVEM